MGISLPGGARNLGVYAERTAETNTTFEVSGMAEFSKKLDALLTTDPEMEKKIQQIIGRALKEGTKQMARYVDTSVIQNDPRHAAKAIRYTVYRRILGGNMNILQRRKRGAVSSYTPERHQSSGRGGNRVTRSDRTTRMEGYEGADRGFILRFLESGARRGGGRRKLSSFRKDEHRANVLRGSQGGNLNKYGALDMVNTGNRGSITARNWFAQAADMERVAAIFEDEVDKAIEEVFGHS